jgi:hypothetical protein
VFPAKEWFPASEPFAVMPKGVEHDRVMQTLVEALAPGVT